MKPIFHPSLSFSLWSQKKTVRHQLGFTLIEVMVVLIIIGLLATIVVERFFGITERARYTQAQVQMRSLDNALKRYKLDHGRFPTTTQGLDVLVHQPSSGIKAGYWPRGGYLEKPAIPSDPWGQAYIYISPGINSPDYELKSLGADGLEGGEGIAADLESWRLP